MIEAQAQLKLAAPLLVLFTTVLWMANPAVALATAADSDSDQPDKLRELCTNAHNILEAVLVDRAGPSDVLSSEAPDYAIQPTNPVSGIRRMTPFGPDSVYWRIGWEGQPPPPVLVQRWYKLPYGSISRCVQSKKVDQPLVSVLQSKVNQFIPADGQTPSTVRVSYPAFNHSKTQAILLYSRFFRHALGGRLELVFLTRTKFGWKKTGSRGLWQS